jgi:pyocin large subunit-like protein
MKSVMSVIVLAAVLAGCNKNPADQSARDHSGAQPSASYAMPSTSSGSKVAEQSDARDAPVPKAADGKPIWTANRQRTAEQNAQAAFERNGEAFEAKDVDTFVAKAHAFTNHPPSGVQKISRANGDTELYDAKTNIFAVVSKEGAPRTIFKPDNGSAYWDKEMAKNSDNSGGGYKSKGDYKSDGERTSKRKTHGQDDG